jgi:hypothetical protein
MRKDGVNVKQDQPMDAARKGPNTLNGSALARQPRSNMRPPQDTVIAGLQKMFAAIADEPIPDDFLRLLDKIEANEALGQNKGDICR